MRGAVDVGARNGRVAARVDGLGLGCDDPVRRGGVVEVHRAEPGEARARRRDARQLGRAVLPRLPGRGLAPPVAAQGDVPHVVRDDAVGAFEVDLSVAVHVLDGQRPLTKGIIAKIVEGERNELEFRVGVGGIGARRDELVRRVVLVGGNQQSAAEAGAGFADGAAERVFVGTTPTAEN